jgi:hypothetical protein
MKKEQLGQGRRSGGALQEDGYKSSISLPIACLESVSKPMVVKKFCNAPLKRPANLQVAQTLV